MIALLAAIALQQQPAQERPRVTVEPAAVEIGVDDGTTLRAAAELGGAAIADAKFRWVSTDPSVATVDSTGAVKALHPGEARVYAVYENRGAGFAAVTVPQLPPSEIELTLDGGAVAAGGSAPLGFEARTRLGDALPDEPIRFSSSDPSVASVDATGRVFGMKPGRATIRAEAGRASRTLAVRVVANPAVSYRLTPEATEVRTGDVVRLRVQGLDARGRVVSTPAPSWSVTGEGAMVEAEGTDGVFVAERPGTYAVVAQIGPDAVERANVRVTERSYPTKLEFVGRGPATGHQSGDTWVWTGVDGRDYAMIGTFMYDWLKVWDVTDPAHPVLTDSLQLDARRINDVKIHPNGRIAIVTREGASNRRNGIVFLDLSNPAHPTRLSEYEETVTGGVHNTWVDAEHELVYAVHDGDSDMHIIDIADPKNPTEVGRWGLDKQAKTLHDVILQDGYAYLSYWDDGLVILDVGAGTHGGTPREPTFVSRIAYPEGNTHVAWRYKNYVFLGDEIFPSDWDPHQPIEARGFVHVIDVSDIDHPRQVAKYEVPEAGAHNLWVEDDKMYIGYYQGGLRVVDVSGELRGDLYRQGREMGVLKTAASDGYVPNWGMTWGAQVFKGNVFTSDLNSGLWIARLTPEKPTT